MLNYLPEDFNRLYLKLIKANSVKDIKDKSTMLMKAVKDFTKQMKDKFVSKKEISETDINGTYEEIYSNWKNKMYYAIDRNDAYLSLMTAASCQQFYDEMYSKYNIDRIDLMKNIKPDNLSLAAKAFDDAMEKYKENYNKLRHKIKYYKNLDEFERAYLGGKEHKRD